MKILHLEDNATDAMLVRELLTGEWPDCQIDAVATREAYLKELKAGGHDLILSDFTLAAFDGLSALKLALEHAPATPFVFLSGTIGEERAIEAVRAGASDYVIKDRIKRLVTAVPRALRESDEKNAGPRKPPSAPARRTIARSSNKPTTASASPRPRASCSTSIPAAAKCLATRARRSWEKISPTSSCLPTIRDCRRALPGWAGTEPPWANIACAAKMVRC